jgi:FKBP-type peptidyl-prolyl cis-trans isomerase SlyD
VDPDHAGKVGGAAGLVNAITSGVATRFTRRAGAEGCRARPEPLSCAPPFAGVPAMKIEKNRVVRFHYTVAEAGGAELETSRGREPLMYLAGHGGIIPGLESALEGKQAGDKVAATVTPEQAYGERRDGLVQRIPKKHFGKTRLVPGASIVLQTRQGPRMVTVQKVGMSVVDVDLNHPMAGKTLAFDVEILEVREATEEEIAHGHAHGDGGHKHD